MAVWTQWKQIFCYAVAGIFINVVKLGLMSATKGTQVAILSHHGIFHASRDGFPRGFQYRARGLCFRSGGTQDLGSVYFDAHSLRSAIMMKPITIKAAKSSLSGDCLMLPSGLSVAPRETKALRARLSDFVIFRPASISLHVQLSYPDGLILLGTS